VTKGQQEKAFDTAIFNAKKGQIEGPVKTQFGYYVFQVQKITPASQQTLEQAKATIRGILASENQQKALDTWIKDFQEEWKDRPEWIVSAEETVKNVWESSYKGCSTAHGIAGQGRPVEPDANANAGENLTRWERKRLAVTQLPANLDMLHCFQQEAQIHPVWDVVGWWYERLHDPHWKDLA